VILIAVANTIAIIFLCFQGWNQEKYIIHLDNRLAKLEKENGNTGY